MNRIKRVSPLMLVVVSIAMLARVACIAADTKPEPSVDKTSILVKTVKQLFWAGNDKQVWKWTPSIEFRVNGPLAAGTQIYAEYSIQGKPWLSYKCEDVGEIDEYGYWNTYGGRESEPFKGKASTYTGYVDFAIKAKNPLENTNKTLYTGKFNVKKFPYPSSQHANFKEAYTYYVDYDWALPIGLLTYARKEMNVEWETPLRSPALFYMWFKGDEHKHKDPVAYLYFNGQKIGDTTGSNGACWEKASAQTWEGSDQSYHFYQFIFNKVLLGEKKGAEQSPDTFKLWQNPGDYEIKVLWEGKLARTAKWTMTSTGISDNGLGVQLNAKCFQPDPKQWTDSVRVYPVTITDNLGIVYNKAAWKTDAYFGQPLKGFVAP